MAEVAENLFDPDQETIRIVNACLRESQEGKRRRLELNRINRDAYHNQQDWSHKIEGQSKEFLPKTAETVEQFAAFLKRGLTQFGDWFSVSSTSPISDESIRKLMRCFLENLPAEDNSTTSFGEILSDAGKVGLLESIMVFKVHGGMYTKNFFVEEGDVIEQDHWRLQIDLVSPESYDKDPTGRGLYEIHTVMRDLHHVRDMAERGIYNQTEVDKIKNDFEQAEEEKRKDPTTPDPTKDKPSFRKSVQIREFWGTLLNFDGTVKRKNVLVTIANDKYVLREVEFPFWHGESPFVTIPLMRVPFSIWHRALYDQVVPLNFALNEMFNLMLDGGLAAVWGIKQLRLDLLEDPRQVADGIPQGKTLAIREDVPEGMKVLEQVTEGTVPNDAMAMYTLLDREFNASALTNDIKMGLLPPKQVRATEVVEATQSQAVILDSIVGNIERRLEILLRKAWLTIAQNADDLMAAEVADSMTQPEMFLFASMSPRERFGMFAQGCTFKVHGLSATLAKARDFQRIMALLQVGQTSPLLAPAMMRRWSPDKLLTHLTKIMNLNPENLERGVEDVPVGQDVQLFRQISDLGRGNQNVSSEATGEPGLPSEINQEGLGSVASGL